MVPNHYATVVQPCTFRSFCFRGEGRANFVISAKCKTTGSRIAWRLAKHRKSGLISTKPKCRVVIAYLEKLIVPFLGRQFLVKPKIVEIDFLSLHNIAKIPSLPMNLKVETYEELCDAGNYSPSMSFFPLTLSKNVRFVSILQMMDATRIPMHISTQYFGPTITVEIKPKQGFKQDHPGVNVSFCNNCILQLEKCSTDAFDQMYDFCPLDLFSGNIERMRKALNSLVLVPHRNLRLFLNGTLIHCDEIQLSKEQLSETLMREANVTTEQLVSGLCCVLVGASSDQSFSVSGSSVLARLLQGQRIDTIGIVRAFQMYTALPEADKKQLLNKCLLPQRGLSFLNSTTDRALLERYLLAATMKDCSLMISLRLLNSAACNIPDEAIGSQQTVRVCNMQSTNTLTGSGTASTTADTAIFAYSVKIVDLDPKSPKNLLNAYKRFMRGVELIKRMPDSRRPCVS